MGLINIAIDGPAGAGKSTIAKSIARTMGILYLDTGAMYRTVALKAIREGIDTKDMGALEKLVGNINIDVAYEKSGQVIYLDGENVNDRIRTPEVSVGASNVAVVPAVRLKMVDIQRKIASANSVVMDGRDIGTYVLPNADLKIYLTASVEERARRRYDEQLEKGIKDVDFEEVRKDIEYRDRNDSSREFAPLSVAKDAIVLDTTGFEVEEAINKVMKLAGNIK